MSLLERLNAATGAAWKAECDAEYLYDDLSVWRMHDGDEGWNVTIQSTPSTEVTRWCDLTEDAAVAIVTLLHAADRIADDAVTLSPVNVEDDDDGGWFALNCGYLYAADRLFVLRAAAESEEPTP